MTTPLERSLERIVTSLATTGHRCALVGGLAVSVRAEPRLTRDADLAVVVDGDSEAETLIRRLRQFGYQERALIEQDDTGRLATVRLAHDDDGDVVSDLLFASSGIEAEIVADADELDVVPGLRLQVASVGHLIATKLLARDDRHRPTDADDLRALRSVATDEDWLSADVAVRLIHERRYQRDRNLINALVVLRRDGAF